jgi:integrase
MVLACARPWRHPATGVYWLRRRVPARLRTVLPKREILFTLATHLPGEARSRHARLAARIDDELSRIAAGELPAGMLCAGHISPFRSGREMPANGLTVTSAVIEPHVPAPAVPSATTQASPPVDLGDLFDGYANEAALSPATRKRWRPVMDHLARHAGTPDAARMTPEILVAWKDHLLEEGRSPVTVRDVYLAAVKATLGWGLDQKRLRANPAQGLRVRVPKAVMLRDRGFTDEEAHAILVTTLAPQDSRISRENAAVRRWVPWLLAYTGARVNEITQARGKDIRAVGAIWVLRITPDAGRVKTQEFRDVPLHSELVRQGFLSYVERRGLGPLFYDPGRSSGSEQNPIYKRMGQKLGEWVRTIVADPQVDPSHGWRHRFKTVGRAAGIPDTYLDAIQGHAPATTGRRYGSFPLTELAGAIERLPVVRTDTPKANT